jgi:YHS domain-containing protein
MKKIVCLGFILMICFLSKVYAADIEINNKICPVSHEEVGANGMTPHKVTYKGKIYNLCCSMCDKDFNKDPEKYVKIMEEEVASETKKM